jgi:hypothetical protein
MSTYDYYLSNDNIGRTQQIRETVGQTHITTVYGDGSTSTTTSIG